MNRFPNGLGLARSIQGRGTVVRIVEFIHR